MSNLPAHHPTGEHLLRYADGELPAREAGGVRTHLEACWECRTELDQLQRTVVDCMRYRKIWLQEHLPPPPRAWAGFDDLVAEAEAAVVRRSLHDRWGTAARRIAAQSRWWIPGGVTVALAAAALYQLQQQAAKVSPPPVVESPRVSAAASRPLPPASVSFAPRVSVTAPVVTPPAPPVLPATAGDELRVLAALQRIGADLGEPVDVTRSEEKITVRGVGIEADRQRQIRGAVGSLPRVVAEFSDPAAAPSPEPAAESPSARISADALRAQAELEQRLGGRSVFEQFAESVLERSDVLMARAHALRRLALHFPVGVASKLSSAEQLELHRLRAEHAGVLAQQVREILVTMQPALIALGAPPAPAAPSAMHSESWQAATEQLFQAAQDVERHTAALVGGAGSGIPARELPGRMTSRLAQLKTLADTYSAEARNAARESMP
jgi:hypothetical protein